MALYWIGYDLDKPGQNYSDLITRLKELGGVPILKSDWLLGHNNTKPDAIRDDLKRFLDTNDRIMVSELKNSAAWRNLLSSDQVVLDLFKKYAI